MVKLFVDDWREAPKGWDTARTITEAVEVLSQGKVEVLSLDHDIQNFLGDLAIPDKFTFSFETYATVARYVAVMPKSRRPRLIFLHTSNVEGAILMRNILAPSNVRLIKVDSEYYLNEIEDHLKAYASVRSTKRPNGRS